MELPNEIEWNIIKFLRHPTAKLITEALLKHGRTAADCGTLDAYYRRDPCPNIWLFKVKARKNKYWILKTTEQMMTNEEIDEYYDAYDSKYQLEYSS